MDELHKPLGQQSKDTKTTNWTGYAVGAAALCLLSTAVYFFVDARSETKTVVALSETTQPKTQAPSVQPSTAPTTEPAVPTELPRNPDGTIDFSKVKPLSPLEPLPNTPATSQPAAPAFKPKAKPPQRVSDWVPNQDMVEKSEFGPLPKISDGGVRPLDAYSRSSGVTGANRVAIILGGLGISQTGTQSAIQDLPSNITLGFSPLGNSLQRWMQTARRGGHEVVLQLPMEPLGYPTVNPAGSRTLTSVASPGENLKNLRWALGRMTNYPIVMNYLGSGLTSKPQALRPLLAEIKNRGLGFIDDGSAQASISLDVARSLRLPNTKGNLVLDSVRNADRIRANLQSLEALAKGRGFAIGTASAFPESVAVLKEWAKDARTRGIILVPVSNLLNDYRP